MELQEERETATITWLQIKYKALSPSCDLTQHVRPRMLAVSFNTSDRLSSVCMRTRSLELVLKILVRQRHLAFILYTISSEHRTLYTVSAHSMIALLMFQVDQYFQILPSLP
jgi:hypothetical protein